PWEFLPFLSVCPTFPAFSMSVFLVATRLPLFPPSFSPLFLSLDFFSYLFSLLTSLAIGHSTFY
ncbi:hypothetical protein ACQP3C_30045, partial [Escherichia coli]